MDRIRRLRIAYVAVAWGIVVAVLVQVSLIGLWLFASQPTLYLHKEFGHGITLMVLALLVLAFVGRFSAATRLTATLLSVVTVVQAEVFAFLPGSPLRAFHTVLPLVIFSLAGLLAYRAIPLVRVRPKASAFPLSIAEPRGEPNPSVR
jgi:hypothetical protein